MRRLGKWLSHWDLRFRARLAWSCRLRLAGPLAARRLLPRSKNSRIARLYGSLPRFERKVVSRWNALSKPEAVKRNNPSTIRIPPAKAFVRLREDAARFVDVECDLR